MVKKDNFFFIIIIIQLYSLLVIQLFSNEEIKRPLQNGIIQVKNKIIIEEIYDINISEGHFKIAAEFLQTWNNNYLKSDKLKVYTGQAFDDFLHTIWSPKFIITNEEESRNTSVQMLVVDKKGELKLYEKFSATVAMNTDIKEYPFGELDLKLVLSAYTHTTDEMVFIPESLQFGHDNNDPNSVIKGNWTIVNNFIKETTKKSLLFNDKDLSQNEFHFVIKHDFMDALQKIFIPLIIIIIISLFINYYCRMKYKENYELNLSSVKKDNEELEIPTLEIGEETERIQKERINNIRNK